MPLVDTTFSHDLPYGGVQRPPPPKATYALLIAMGATLGIEYLIRALAGDGLFLQIFAIHVDWMYRPWTLVTSTFAHADVTHLFFNGLFLYFFGPNVEFLLGRRRFVGLFLIAGGLSGLAQVELEYALSAWDPALFAPHFSLGASGALMALLGVSLILLPHTKMIVFPVPVPVPLWVGGLIFALLDIVGAFNPASRIGNFAHLSGLALGLLYGLRARSQMARRGLRIVVAR